MELKAETLKKILKPSDLKQFIVLHKMIAGGKVLNQGQQGKYDLYLERIESAEEEKGALPTYAMRTQDIVGFFNISQPAFLNWREMPTFPKTAEIKHGYYDIKQIYDWYVIYFYGDADTAKQMAQEKLKYQMARSERERLEMEEIKGWLVRKEDFKRKLTEVIVIAKDSLLLWSKTLPPEFALKHEDQKRVMRIIDKETKRILTILAKGVEAVRKFTKENS